MRRTRSNVPCSPLLILSIGGMLTIWCKPAWPQSVLQYHFSANRAGNYVIPNLTAERARSMHLDNAFDGRVDGHIYAQPLLFTENARQLLIIATENDVVDALDARTGRPIWQRSLGPAVKSWMLPCGNIDPLGITGTPAIDPSRRAIYLDALVMTNEGPQHLIFGLSLQKGEVLPGFPVNIAHALAGSGFQFVPRYQNQRGALLIIGNRVYIPYGGHFGDCGQYHGWVVGVGLAPPHRATAWNTSAAGGGVWAPAGIVSDGHSLFIATGNTFETREWAGGEAVIRLSPNLEPPKSTRDYFTPSDWHRLDGRDADLGGTAPIPLTLSDSSATTHLMLALGKDGKAYLLNRDNLGGVGGALTTLEISRGEIKTAPAAYPAADGGALVAFAAEWLNCPKPASNPSIGALRLQVLPQPSISAAWCAPLDGGGVPIVTTTDGRSNPIVWIVGAEGDERLHAFRGETGEPLLTVPQVELKGLRRFAAIVATEERIFVPSDGRVYAFTP